MVASLSSKWEETVRDCTYSNTVYDSIPAALALLLFSLSLVSSITRGGGVVSSPFAKCMLYH
uniref:Uncharacterized protein n=1 Tax=Amphimedon queenslandica TaxID=400682 RepID=A0A1X7VUC5_AMPQE